MPIPEQAENNRQCNGLGKNILLASHDSIGARAAEQFALEYCQQCQSAAITHLIVIPDFWRGMLGDDWLNSGNTRRQFMHYLENSLQLEIEEHICRLQKEFKQYDIAYRKTIKTGDPADCLFDTVRELQSVDCVILGSQRPKGVRGLRSYMLTKSIFRRMGKPLLIIPYPSTTTSKANTAP